MTSAHDVIHAALVAALQKHGQSAYGAVAGFDPNATETQITGVYKLRFVSEDIATAVQNYIASVTLPYRQGTSRSEVPS